MQEQEYKKPEADTIRYWLTEIKENGVNMTDWESEFMESIYHSYSLYHDLTLKQCKIVEKIYTERTP